MSDGCHSSELTFDAVDLIDHQSVSWSNVRQTQYWLHKHFHYAYPGPIRELRQRLMVVPPERYGDQQLCAYTARVVGASGTQTGSIDDFGNQMLFFQIPEAPGDLTFEVSLKVERSGYPHLLPRLTAEQVDAFRAETALTVGDGRMAATARSLAEQHQTPQELAAAINTWVAQAMRYARGVTEVGTTAIEALAIGQGLCQDYAHIMLAICRAANLPARYVSGHMLGEGGSHAWVEVLLPSQDGSFVAVPFDPTNHRRANLSYITIAVGRDYSDVSPTSGTYIAPYQGQLTACKRAGLTCVEYVAA